MMQQSSSDSASEISDMNTEEQPRELNGTPSIAFEKAMNYGCIQIGGAGQIRI